MWQIFKSILESKIDLHIPKVKNFNTFKKENWSRPLNSQIRKKSPENTDCGLVIWRRVTTKY